MYYKIQKRTNELLAKGNITDKYSRIVDIVLFILIILNIAAVCLESVNQIGIKYKEAFNNFELFSVIVFSSSQSSSSHRRCQSSKTSAHIVLHRESRQICRSINNRKQLVERKRRMGY